jgi:hypothetical protein
MAAHQPQVPRGVRHARLGEPFRNTPGVPPGLSARSVGLLGLAVVPGIPPRYRVLPPVGRQSAAHQRFGASQATGNTRKESVPLPASGGSMSWFLRLVTERCQAT